jgi:WD40 repeat protein
MYGRDAGNIGRAWQETNVANSLRAPPRSGMVQVNEKRGRDVTHKRTKAALTGMILANLVWCLSLCSIHAGANKPAEPSQPVKLKEICNFEKKDGDMPERFLSVVFAPNDGQRVYTTSFAPKSGQVFLRSWDIAKGQVLWERAVATIEERRNIPPGAYRLTIEPQGYWIAFNDYEKVQVWEVRDWVFEDKGAGIKGHVFQAGRKHGDLKVAVEGTNRWVHAVRVSPGGLTLAAVYSGQRITWWDAVFARSSPPRFAFAQTWRPGENKREINAWDATCNQLLCLAFDPASGDPRSRKKFREVAVAGNYFRIAFWDLETRKKVRHWQIEDPEKPGRDAGRVYDLDWMQVKDQRYWVSAHARGEDYLFSYGRGVTLVLPGEDGGQSEGFVLVWDESGKKIARCHHAGAVLAVAVSPNDSWFVSGEFCKGWKVVPPNVAADPPRRGKWVDFLDLPSRVYLWDISGRKLAVGEGHNMGITDVAVSPDGKRIASCSADGTLRIWEVPATIPSRE